MAENGKVKEKNYFIYALILAILSTFIFGFVTLGISNVQSDFKVHVALAKRMATSEIIKIPHFLFEKLVVITKAIIPFELIPTSETTRQFLSANSYTIAGLVVSMVAYAAIALLIFSEVKKFIAQFTNKWLRLLLIGVPLALMIIAPISMFTYKMRDFYFGYIGISVYHSPTQILLKPFSILLFWVVLKNISSNGIDKKTALLTILLTVCDLLIKPSFMTCFLPAIFIFWIISMIRKSRVNWQYLCFCLFLPALIVLVLQYLIMYGQNGGSSIIFAPLTLALHYVPSIPGLILRFFLSIAFPLTAIIIFWKKIIKDKFVAVAMFAFLIGAFMNYFLAETGDRMYDWNFSWSAEITLFILFLEAVFFIFRNFKDFSKLPKWVIGILGAALMLHLMSGAVWYGAEALRPHNWWGWLWVFPKY